MQLKVVNIYYIKIRNNFLSISAEFSFSEFDSQFGTAEKKLSRGQILKCPIFGSSPLASSTSEDDFWEHDSEAKFSSLEDLNVVPASCSGR